MGVHDGDSLTILDASKKTHKIRLAEIDSPEAKQPYGSRAKQVLSDLVFEKTVTVTPRELDRYGRVVGDVYLSDVYINQELVSLGSAWVYREYSKSAELLSAETEARLTRRGLWSLPESERQPPWEWRNPPRAEPKAASKPLPAPITKNFNSCCKVCNKGKPCGDSCISRNKSCHKGVGCAC